MVERKERLVAHVGEHLQGLLLARADRIGHPDPAAALRFGLRFTLATLEQAILFDDTGAYGIPDSDERLAAELTRAFLAYLDPVGDPMAPGLSANPARDRDGDHEKKKRRS